MTTTAAAATNTDADFNSCLVLYATQSGRARACARRASRILAERAVGGAEAASSSGNGGDATTTSATNTAATATAASFRVSAHRPVDDRCCGMSDVLDFASRYSRSGNGGKNNDRTLLVFFVSTTGDGEQPDSMQPIWKQLLRKSLPPDLFAGVPVAVFCLGDRAYGDQFCAAGRKFAVRLLQLGAALFCGVGYGDDGTPGGGVFADLDAWLRDELLRKLRDASKLREPGDDHGEQQQQSVRPPPCPYRVKVSSSSSSSNGNDDSSAKESPPSSEAEYQWRDPKYETSYREFTNTLRPLTAYRYSCSNNNNNNNGGDSSRPPWPIRVNMDDDAVAAAASEEASANNDSHLLKGRVTVNQRITAEDWEQNTRHVHLNVSLLGSDEGSDNDYDCVQQIGRNNLPPGPSDQSDAQQKQKYLPYRAGDVAVVLPCNSAKEVQRLVRVLPQKIQDIVDNELEIEYDNSTQEFYSSSSPPWPRRCTLRGWLTLCADIHTLPEREDLRALAAYCPPAPAAEDNDDGNNIIDDPARQQREKLIALSEPSKAGALYVDYILREKRTWADVLYDFDSLRAPESALTVEALLMLLAPIRPREFSIASSPTRQVRLLTTGASSGKDGTLADAEPAVKSFGLELCVAVVEGKTPLGRSFHGLCSTYISQLNPNSIVRMWIRPGSFHGLPLDLDYADINGGNKFKAPVLYVAAGTGVAPIRGLIQEREATRLSKFENKLVAEEVNGNNGELIDLDRDNVLFFGCRKEKADFYYEKEWVSLATVGRLGIRTAFSRDQWHKIYVQKVLEKADEESRLIARHILEKNGAIYIAGGPKMAKAVKEVIVESLATEMGGDEKGAKQVLARLQRLGMYSVEAWS